MHVDSKLEVTKVSVFIFPGQGAQFSGMGMDLFTSDADGSSGIRALFETASGIIGSDIKDLLNSDAEILKQTDVSQIAITVASLAAVRSLASRGITPSACAGFSLGEYPALAVSGVISEADAIRITLERGRIMQKVCATITGAGMAAVLGLTPAQIDSVIASIALNGSLFAANYNSPLQTVISGTSEALDAAEEAFKAAGARRIVRLKVAGPFHSPLMALAGEQFSSFIEGFTFADPKIPVFSNVTGKQISSGEEAKKCAVLHITKSVRWTDEEASIADLMAASGITDLIEAGPGKVLSGLWADSKLAGICKPYTEA